MADLTGRTLGKYRIVEVIGQGRMATVYKACQPALERYVAIKVFHKDLAAEAELFLARFEREVRTLAALRHPHIVSVLDSGSQGGAPYLVMEYLPGTTLQARLRAPMPLPEVARIGAAVAGALAYGHHQGIVHRNLNPDKVMLTTAGGIVLTDLGIAALLGIPQVTASGVIGGDPATMAPEQGRGEPGDERSDIYALGVLLYRMVAGRLPFEADTPLALLEKHIHDPVSPPCQVNPGVPPAVESIILKALAKNPADRYQQAGDLVGELADASKTRLEGPGKPPDDILHHVHVDFVVKGKVSALLERGFSLDTGQGATTIVSTLSRGDQLGLRPGDQVRVFGGPDPRTGEFRSSSTIHKILPNGKEIEIKDAPHKRHSD
jgi:serine/threonine protein kinase